MSQLMEEILSRENMILAYKKVKANKGASGIDGISVEEVSGYLKKNWPEIRERIRNRKYKPQPVLRVEIPKPIVVKDTPAPRYTDDGILVISVYDFLLNADSLDM